LLARSLLYCLGFKVINNIKNNTANASVLNVPCHILQNTCRVIHLTLSRRFKIEHDFLFFYALVAFIRSPPTDFRTYAVKTYKSMQILK
jgi:hypothetical protein